MFIFYFVKANKVLQYELIPLNIKARYPDDKEKIFKLMNYNRARSIFKRTKEFFLWIEQLLNQ